MVLRRHADADTNTRHADRDARRKTQDARRKTQETRHTTHDARQGDTQTQTLGQREKLLVSFAGSKSLSDAREEDIPVIQRLTRPGQEEGGWGGAGKHGRGTASNKQPQNGPTNSTDKQPQKPSERVIIFFLW